MSTTDARHAMATDRRADEGKRRSDLDHDLVAVLAMIAILALTALCFLGSSVLSF